MYTAKNIYPTYLRFLIATARMNYSFAVLAIGTFILSVPYYILKVLNSEHRSFFDKHELTSGGWAFVSVFGFLLLFSLLTNYLVWRQSFTVRDGQIIDFFPKKKVFRIDEIDHINLMSPTSAHVLVKHRDDHLFTSCYWFGRDEAEWNHFISLLTSNTPSIADRIFVKTNRFGNPQFVKHSPETSYPAVLKVHRKSIPT